MGLYNSISRGQYTKRRFYSSQKISGNRRKKDCLFSCFKKCGAPPVIITVALSLSASLGGALIFETIFNWPGMGLLYFDAINLRDTPVIFGQTYILGINLPHYKLYCRYDIWVNRSKGEIRMIFKAISNYQIIHEFKNSKIGLFGVAILLFLIGISIYAVSAIPLDSYRQWNNPNYWIKYPKAAMPAWINIFSSQKQPEDLIMDKPIVSKQTEEGIVTMKYTYKFVYNYDFFPSDFMLNYAVQYGIIPPLVSIQLTRPDGNTFELLSKSLPSAEGNMYPFMTQSIRLKMILNKI